MSLSVAFEDFTSEPASSGAPEYVECISGNALSQVPLSCAPGFSGNCTATCTYGAEGSFTSNASISSASESTSCTGPQVTVSDAPPQECTGTCEVGSVCQVSPAPGTCNDPGLVCCTGTPPEGSCAGTCEIGFSCSSGFGAPGTCGLGEVCCALQQGGPSGSCATVRISTQKQEYVRAPSEPIEFTLNIARGNTGVNPQYTIGYTKVGGATTDDWVPSTGIVVWDTAIFTEVDETIQSGELERGVYTFIAKTSPACPSGSASAVTITITEPRQAAAPEIPTVIAIVVALVVVFIIVRKP